MARLKDQAWNLPEGKPISGGSTEHVCDSIHAALLMDIRDELKRLNGVFGCANFLEVPGVLRAIKRNTTKPRRRRKKADAK